MGKKKKLIGKNGYEWKFVNVGGMTRVDIQSGKDIAHLGELDRKLWTVLSCPATGLEFDKKTLEILDKDKDGQIHVDEVISTAEYLCSVLKDPETLIAGSDTIKLDNLNTENAEGAKLHNSAKQVLANLGIESDGISVANTSDSVAIFAKTRFNGDGIITPASTDDEALKKTIETIIACEGAVTDRSGADGTNAEKIEAFFAACADYAAWKAAAKADEAGIFPFGDDTEATLAACEALKEKVADWYMRCKLIGFNAGCSDAVDVAVAKIEAISDRNLAGCTDEIAQYPLARPSSEALLPLDGGINPAWQAAFATLKSAVLDKEFPEATTLSEEQWNSVLAKFGAYEAWKAAKKGAEVEGLGLEAVEAILAQDSKAALLDLVAQDAALVDEANAIDAVDHLTHLHRDFYHFLRNYVSFKDFFSANKKELAVFQSGKLFIDQRCCELCIKVSDMGKHGDMAALSGMYILYCACTSKSTGKSVNIAAVLTDGDVDCLRAGMNAIYYDRDGLDYDAVITKIVDNPISIRQAFWSPYRKMGNAVQERINKSAAEKDNAVNADLINKANTTTIPTTAEEKAAAAQPKAPFDIAKFAGIFAAVGMAAGLLGSAIAAIVKPWYTIFFVFLAIILVISGPSMFIAWRKLRKRNLAPVLNANGWAINAAARVNIKFGATLTSLAKYPKVKMDDPFAKKKMPAWKRALIWIAVIVVLLGGTFSALFFTNKLEKFGLVNPWKKAPVEEVIEAPTEEAAEVPVDTAEIAEIAPDAAPAE